MGVAGLPLGRVVRVRFWELVAAGHPVRPACGLVGVSHETGRRWFAQAGGVIGNAPRPLGDRYLSLAEREEISRGLTGELSFREIARRLGRAPSTISREVELNGGLQEYRAVAADAAARVRARRPKPAKLAADPALAERAGDSVERPMVVGADRGHAQVGVPRSAGAAGVARNHLPSDLRPRPGRVAPRTGCLFAHRTSVAPSPQASPRSAPW